MTHSTHVKAYEGHPAWKAFVTLDIGELDETGVEHFDPRTEADDKTGRQILADDDLTACTVLSWADGEKLVFWESGDEVIRVKNLKTGKNVAVGSAVGEVVLMVRGE